MVPERLCPVCGRIMKRYAGSCRTDGTCDVYGARLSLGYKCEDSACGFRVAFPFDRAVYCAYACAEIRRRTRTLPADARARALLLSIGYCRESGEDALSQTLSEQLQTIFMEALGEILRESRVLLRDLSHREPDEEKRHESRQRLAVFFRFLSFMEGQYPTPKLEADFGAVREGLAAIDASYELGMLVLDSDLDEAARHFERGCRENRIRSCVAYAKYVLSARAETPEELSALKDTFFGLAERSQDACYEYLCRATIGEDDISAVLKAYEDASYTSATTDGRLAFVRLELTACIEFYIPALSAIVSSRRDADDPESDAKRAEEYDRAMRILGELSALTGRITAQCETILPDEQIGSEVGAGDTVFERSMLMEESMLLEYVIGSLMYYQSCFDAEKRFDVHFLRVAIGHLSCFLASGLIESRTDALVGSALIGNSALQQIGENARVFRRVLTECAGLGGGEG